MLHLRWYFAYLRIFFGVWVQEYSGYFAVILSKKKFKWVIDFDSSVFTYFENFSWFVSQFLTLNNINYWCICISFPKNSTTKIRGVLHIE